MDVNDRNVEINTGNTNLHLLYYYNILYIYLLLFFNYYFY